MIGGSTSIDVKDITGDYLASKVHEYTHLYPGKIMSSFSDKGKREYISVKALISVYYELQPDLNYDLDYIC